LTSGKALARTQSAETMSKVVAERLVAQTPVGARTGIGAQVNRAWSGNP
jgi:hypothetical protein